MTFVSPVGREMATMRAGQSAVERS